MNKLPRFTRNEYNAVKHMDRRQMEEWIFKVHNNAYEAGYEDGMKELPDPKIPDLTGLEEELQKIRGIGGSKARLVYQVVDDFVRRKESEESSDE